MTSSNCILYSSEMSYWARFVPANESREDRKANGHRLCRCQAVSHKQTCIQFVFHLCTYAGLAWGMSMLGGFEEEGNGTRGRWAREGQNGCGQRDFSSVSWTHLAVEWSPRILLRVYIRTLNKWKYKRLQSKWFHWDNNDPEWVRVMVIFHASLSTH